MVSTKDKSPGDIPEAWKPESAGGGPDALRLDATSNAAKATLPPQGQDEGQGDGQGERQGEDAGESGCVPVALKDAKPVGPADAGAAQIRPAGPEAMRDPPRQWEKTDESSDKSFPASDPPAVSPGPSRPPPAPKDKRA